MPWVSGCPAPRELHLEPQTSLQPPLLLTGPSGTDACTESLTHAPPQQPLLVFLGLVVHAPTVAHPWLWSVSLTPGDPCPLQGLLLGCALKSRLLKKHWGARLISDLRVCFRGLDSRLFVSPTRCRLSCLRLCRFQPFDGRRLRAGVCGVQSPERPARLGAVPPRGCLADAGRVLWWLERDTAVTSQASPVPQTLPLCTACLLFLLPTLPGIASLQSRSESRTG